jgi:hypothetical protein
MGHTYIVYDRKNFPQPEPCVVLKGGEKGGYILWHKCKICITKMINLRDCALDHRKSACEHLPWDPSSPDYCCTSYHTPHSIHNRMILIPEMKKDYCSAGVFEA